jgi:hypothetical protein
MPVRIVTGWCAFREISWIGWRDAKFETKRLREEVRLWVKCDEPLPILSGCQVR